MTDKVYIVTVDDAEATMIISLHRTMEGALESWNKKRLELIETAQSYIDEEESWDKDMWLRIKCSLEETDPEKIHGWPHDTPHITEYEVVD